MSNSVYFTTLKSFLNLLSRVNFEIVFSLKIQSSESFQIFFNCDSTIIAKNFHRWNFTLHALPEKCPNTEFFLVRILSHSDWIGRDAPYLSVFSPTAGKHRTEKAPYFGSFWKVINMCKEKKNYKFNNYRFHWKFHFDASLLTTK